MEHFDSTKGAGSGAHLREAVTRAIGCNSHSGIVPQAKRGCKPVFPGCIGLLYKGCLLQNWGSLRDFIISHLYTFLMILSPMGYSVQAVPSKQEQHPNRLGCRWEVSIPEKYQPQKLTKSIFSAFKWRRLLKSTSFRISCHFMPPCTWTSAIPRRLQS